MRHGLGVDPVRDRGPHRSSAADPGIRLGCDELERSRARRAGRAAGPYQSGVLSPARRLGHARGAGTAPEMDAVRAGGGTGGAERRIQLEKLGLKTRVMELMTDRDESVRWESLRAVGEWLRYSFDK